MSNESLPSGWLTSLRRGLTDLWFLLSVAIGLLLLILLLGYHSGDPGWSTTGSGGEVQHWLGTPGAYAADMLISLFGYGAYLIPVGLIFIGWKSVRRSYIDAELMLLKISGLIVSTLALCGVLTFHWPEQINSWAVTGGGVVGQKISVELLKLWPVSGVMGVYTLLLLIGLTLLFEVNWLKVCGWIGLPLYLLGRKVLRKSEKITQDTGEAESEKAIQEPTAIPEPTLAEKAKPPRRAWFGRAEPDSDLSLQNEEPVKESPAFTATRFDGKPSSRTAPTLMTEVEKPPRAERSEPSVSLNWAEYKNDDVSAPETAMPTEMSAEMIKPVLPESDYDFDFAVDDADSVTPVSHAQAQSVASDFDTENPFAEYDAFAKESVAVDFASERQTEAAPLDDSLAAIQGDEEDDLDKTSTGGGLKVRLGAGKSDSFYSPARKTSAQYHLPTLDLLQPTPLSTADYSDEELDAMAQNVEEALKNYRLSVQVVNIEVGPVVTRLELELAPGIKVSQISNLDKDLARSLAVQSVRVVEVIPGKPYIGLEIPNRKREIVPLRAILESSAYRDQKSPLTVVLGADISGAPVVANLAKMPHLLVAGTTGSGKSVAINVMLASMLYKARPDELKLILVDPKMLEMNLYEDIPHLLTPVVTDMNEAENVLRWAVAEMERRYQLMAAFKVRNIAGFNQTIRDLQENGERIDDPLWNPEDHLGLAHQPPQIDTLPYIVIVIDELADMMMAVGKKVEELIARIAQKARAAGIHLILATQRPSVDVITGLIKANVPTRLAFQVSSKIDSRTIIDQQGADALLGYGDGLFVPPGSSAPQRVHGAFIEDREVDALTSYIKTQGEPNYEDSIINPVPPSAMGAFGAQEKSDDPELDPLYDEACQMVIESNKASISWLQRRLSIGYNRSARLIETMEQAGIVSAPDRGTRKVLVGRSEEDY